MEQLAAWGKLDQRIGALTSQLKVARSHRKALKSAVDDPMDALLEADRKWAKASLRAVRAELANRIASGAKHLAMFGAAPRRGEQFKRTIVNSFNYLRG
ncbi:MAG: hypothetical protein OXF03_00480 [Gammaproteobacteria bacterium]|nr:hypothetical protein [Gammaproteobacteria bacterium]MCY4341879.1 hypothetical protein [Gammaproteobacteria bacterium]